MSIFKRVLDKYNSFSEPLKASFWFTVCGVVQKGISILTTPIFTRLLTKEQYGVFSVYLSWYDIVSVFATLNLFYGAYNNAMTKYPERRDKITSSMQGLTSTITILLFVVYLFTQQFWNGVFKLKSIFIFAMFAELLFMPGYNFWAAKERYDYKYRKLIAATLIIAVMSPALGIVTVLLTEQKSEARVLSYVFVQVCVGIVLYIHNLRKGKQFFSAEFWKYSLALNVPLIPHYLSSTILNQADRIMINDMVGTGEAAIYSVAYSVASIMTIITTAIKNTYTPFLYKSLKAKQYITVRRVSNILCVFIAGFTMIAVLLGPEIIMIVAPESYYDAVWVIPPVACAVFFKFLYPMFSTVEFYYEKTFFILLASCIGAAANIGLNFIFIRIYGYYAAGYTTLFCYILYSFGHYVFQRRILKKKEDNVKLFDARFTVIVSLCLLLAMTGSILLYKTFVLRYCVLLCIIAVIVMQKNKIFDAVKLLKDKG